MLRGVAAITASQGVGVGPSSQIDLPVNLFAKPEQIDDTGAWTASNATVSANQAQAPNGLTVMDKLTATGANGKAEQSISFSAGSSLVISGYFKKSNVNYVRWRIFASGALSTYYNLVTGAVGYNQSNDVNITVVDAGSVDVGGGIYRCWIKITTQTITSLVIGFIPAQADAGQSANTDAVLAWGLQAVVGTTLPDYVSPNGTYTVVTGPTTRTVLAPNGDPPTEAALASHRYRHHTAVAVHGGRVWVAFSSSGTNEDAGGQLVVAASSTDDGDTWSAPVAALGPQSTWSGTGASYTAGTRIAYPRCFVVAGGALYLIAAVDNVLGANSVTGAALVACKCNSDGTIDAPARITSASYSAIDSKPAVNYDAALSALLLDSAKLYGVWGGSSPGNTASDWIGWLTSGGADYAEPATCKLNASGTKLMRLWRRITAPTTSVWVQYSDDSGATWTSPVRTGLPNSPGALAALRLSDGRIAVALNPIDMATSRDPLSLWIFDRVTGRLVAGTPLAIRQGVSATPTYAGSYKGGAAAYAGMWESAGQLYVSYSLQKESVGFTRFAIPS